MMIALYELLVCSSSAEVTCARAAIVASTAAIITKNVSISRKEITHDATCDTDLTMTLA